MLLFTLIYHNFIGGQSLSLRLPNLKPADFQRVFLFFPLEVTNVASATTVPNKIFLFIITALFLFL